MRRLSSILAAGVIGIAGAAASFAPAQAAPAAISPAVADQADPGAGIQQVHRRTKCWKHPCYKYSSLKKKKRFYGKYHRPYPYYAYYPYPYPYGYYRRPGVTFSFSFGGGHRGYHGW